MADIDRIKRNLGKMIDGGAPETDIDSYLKSEGFGSADEWRKASAPQRSLVDRAGSYAKGVLREAGQGLALGFADEIGSAIDATLPGRDLISQVRPISQADSWQQRYDENLARERGDRKQFATENPKAATAANLAGAIAGASKLPVSLLSGATLPISMAKGAATGAALGGAQGFGEGEGGFDSRVGGAETGALFGGAIGGIAPLIGGGASAVYEKFAPKVLNFVANKADDLAPKTAPSSLSAAAPEGGQITQDSLAATIADASRATAGRVEGDAAIRRLATEIARSGGSSQARNKLAELGESAFLADTSRGAGRLANLGAILPGEAGEKYTQAFGQRNAQTGPRFLNAMGDEANRPSLFNAQQFLEKYRGAKGSEIYDPVLRQGKVNVSPEMQEMYDKTPAIRDAVEQVYAWAAEHNMPLRQAEVFHMVKQVLNKGADAAYNAGKAVDKGLVGKTADAWEQALWSANPAIKEADTAYAKLASLPDWLERGAGFAKTGQSEAAVNVSPSALAADLPGATPHQIEAFRTGSSNVMRDAATAGPESTRRLAKAISDNEIMQQKLGEIYGPEMADRLLSQSKAARVFAETQGKVLHGAQTAERLAAMADDAAITLPTGSNNPVSLVQALLDRYQQMRQPSEAVRSRLADLLANPDAATNAETLRLVDEILRRQGGTRPFTAGIAGATGGNLSSPR